MVIGTCGYSSFQKVAFRLKLFRYRENYFHHVPYRFQKVHFSGVALASESLRLFPSFVVILNHLERPGRQTVESGQQQVTKMDTLMP